MKSKAKILVVDDNKGIRAALEMLLPRFFAQVEMLSSPKSLLSTIRELQPDVVLLDMNFQTAINTGNEGLYWLSEIKQFAPNIEVVLFTAYGDIQLAVEGMKRGAFDFIVKPWDNNKLVETLTLAYQQKRKRTGKKSPTPLPISNSPSPKMHWGSSPAMTTIRKQLDKVATTDASILITGENGTG